MGRENFYHFIFLSKDIYYTSALCGNLFWLFQNWEFVLETEGAGYF